MAWVKLDDAMPHHPKVMAAGPEAFALDVAGICYSNKHATDGFIAEASLPAVFPALRSPKKWAQKLVEVGRWIETNGGWQIHDVSDYQPSAAEQKAISKKRAEAGKLGGKRSGQSRAKTKQSASDPEPKPKQVARTEANPDPTRPVPDPEGSSPGLVENGKGGMQGGTAEWKRTLRTVAEEHVDQRGGEGYPIRNRDALVAHLMKSEEVRNEAMKRTPAASNVRELLDRVGRPMDGETA